MLHFRLILRQVLPVFVLTILLQVYCADCFENRKPSKSNPGAAFQYPKGKTGAGAQDIRCAVDGCDTKVGPKGEWVGIYL